MNRLLPHFESHKDRSLPHLLGVICCFAVARGLRRILEQGLRGEAPQSLCWPAGCGPCCSRPRFDLYLEGRCNAVNRTGRTGEIHTLRTCEQACSEAQLPGNWSGRRMRCRILPGADAVAAECPDGRHAALLRRGTAYQAVSQVAHPGGC